MIIDIHAHLYDKQFENNTEIIKNLNSNNVEAVINAGVDLETSKQCIQLSKTYDNIYSCIGVHPEFAEKFDLETIGYLKSHFNDKKVVAVGEIGLDYHFRKDNKELQKDVFIKQIKLAYEYKLPIVVHLRDAYGDALEIFKEYKDYLRYGVDIHCFSGSKEYYKEIEKLGFYISLGGSLTFKNNFKGKEVASIINKEKFMLETDCPYLAPDPIRGSVNQPKNIKYVASCISNIFYISPNEVVDMATKNTKSFFNKIKR